MTLNLFFIVDGAVADLIDRYTLLLPIAMCINSANIWNHYFKKNLIYKYLILVNNKSYLREIKPLSLPLSLSNDDHETIEGILLILISFLERMVVK